MSKGLHVKYAHYATMLVYHTNLAGVHVYACIYHKMLNLPVSLFFQLRPPCSAMMSKLNISMISTQLVMLDTHTSLSSPIMTIMKYESQLSGLHSLYRNVFQVWKDMLCACIETSESICMCVCAQHTRCVATTSRDYQHDTEFIHGYLCRYWVTC